MLVLIGLSSFSSAVTSANTAGEHLSYSIGWCLGIYFGILICVKTSGAHLNPAITITLAVFKKFPWTQVPIYILAQMLGAFVAALLVLANSNDSIQDFAHNEYLTPDRILDEKEHLTTAEIFATYPNLNVSNTQAFFDTIIGNMMLSMFIFALTDKKNMNMKPGKIPFAVSLVVLAINVSFGSNCGAVLNPARDFAPRYSL